MLNYTVKALQKLKPESQWRMVENNYAEIEWIELQGDAPTQKEIDAAIKQIKADELNEATTKAAAKASAQEKLAALGLTVEDLTALGL